VIGPSQRPVPDNTQHSQTDSHNAPGGFRTSNPSKQAAADPRLRSCGHRDRLSKRYSAYYLELTSNKFRNCTETRSLCLCLYWLQSMYKRLACFRNTSHHHHHHGVVTQWKDLYFPKGCGGSGPGTGAASGPGGVIGGHPGTPGTQRVLLMCQSSRVYSYSNVHNSTSYLSSVFLFHEIKSVVSSLFRLLATGPRMTQSVIGQ